jgi:hypothetical protein
MSVFACGCGTTSRAAPPEEIPATTAPRVDVEPQIEKPSVGVVAPEPAMEETPEPESKPESKPAAVAAPASFENRPLATQPTTVPQIAAAASAKPASGVLAMFDEQLTGLLQNQAPVTPTSGLTPDDRVLVQSVTDAIASFRLTLRDGTSLMTTKTAPLLDLSDRIHEQIPLSVPTLALCRTVTQFGVYDPIDPARFTAGKETPTIIYCEIEHFRSSLAGEGKWETKLSYEATLYRDGEAAVSVINKKPTSIVDRCRNRRRDFFIADRLTIPATLPVGRYVLKVTVIDQLANHVAEKTVPVLFAPQ